MRLAMALLLLPLLSLPASAEVPTPTDFPWLNSPLEGLSSICVWGWDDGCLIPARECFQPDRLYCT